MDKLQKFEYTQSIESYLEDNQVYELFEGLLKQLVIHRPEQPLDFLVQKLSKPDRKFHFLDSFQMVVNLNLIHGI